MPVDELLREVAVRLAAWSEPLLPKATKESRMSAQCSFFDDDDMSFTLTRHQVSLPALRGAAPRENSPAPRRQYAELYGRDTWNWEHA